MQLTTRNTKLVIYCDGASRGNPGPSSAAFVAVDKQENIIHQQGKYLGHKTNNVAEYQAVILALECLKAGLPSESPALNNQITEKHKNEKTIQPSNHTTILVTINLDSELLYKQITGQYRVKAQHLKPFVIQIHQLLNKIKSKNITVKFQHQLRQHNQLADELANQVLDEKTS